MEYVDNGRGILVPEKLKGRGIYTGQIIRKGEVVDEFEFENLVVNQGINSMLNVYLNAQAGITNWFMGIFQGNYTPVAGDTAATIATNATECSSYTSSTRPQWQQAAASGQAITNAATRATFTFNASVTVYGAFLISNNVIGGTTGTLFSAAMFGAAKAVVTDDQLLLTYQFSMSST